jgi:hypothetical protein
VFSYGWDVALLQRPFSLSTPLLESKEKRAKRLSLKKVKQINLDLKEDWFNTQPDPFLGMQLVVSTVLSPHIQRRSSPVLTIWYRLLLPSASSLSPASPAPCSRLYPFHSLVR